MTDAPIAERLTSITAAPARVVAFLAALQPAISGRDAPAIVRCCDAFVSEERSLPVVAIPAYAGALLAVGRFEDALAVAEDAVSALAAAAPAQRTIGGLDLLDATRVEHGHALAALGHFAKARAVFFRELGHCADYVLGGTNDWARGWALLERRPAVAGLTASGAPRWDGVTSCDVVVVAEGGMGDDVLFARWLPWLREAVRPHQVAWCCLPAASRWLRHCGADVTFEGAGAVWGGHGIAARAEPSTRGWLSRPG